ncbi:MAG: hypothetical protein ACFE96_17590 [Candidatus Hermodarchaeota archaeon]
MEERVRKVKCPHCGNTGNTEGKGFDNQFGWRVSNGISSIPLICNNCRRITLFHEKQQKRARIFIGKKDEIWQKYLKMKANKDVNLNSFLNDESVKQVIEKKDFEVYMGKGSKLYHKRNCGYLSRSRELKHMVRSDAILRGYAQCNACIKEFNLGIIGVCLLIFLIILMVWVVSFSFL